MIFCLDPGHHKSVKGKRSPQVGPGIGIIEYQFNLAVADRLFFLLWSAGHVVCQTMHEETAANRSLVGRRSFAKAHKADALISIHANAAGPGGWFDGARGFVVFYNAFGGESLGACIAGELAGFSHPRRGGLLPSEGKDRKGVIMTDIPAVLTECAFMTNHKDAAFLASPEGVEKFAQAIAAGAIKWAEKVKHAHT